MFSALKPVIYVQISPERLTLKNLKTGEVISEVPELAFSLNSSPASVVNPFAHPRSMVSDFTAAQQLLKRQLRRIVGNSLLSQSPVVVIHPLGSPAGGFTQVERRAFREMALGAGASKVHVWTGRPLTDQEVQSKQPPSNEGEWE